MRTLRSPDSEEGEEQSGVGANAPHSPQMNSAEILNMFQGMMGKALAQAVRDVTKTPTKVSERWVWMRTQCWCLAR